MKKSTKKGARQVQAEVSAQGRIKRETILRLQVDFIVVARPGIPF